MSVLQNFYREEISIKLGTGTGNMYVTDAPSVTSGWLVINPKHPTQREIVKYNGTGNDGSGDYITITERGVGGTVDQEHEIGEPVRMNITAEHWAELVALVGTALVAADLDIDPTLNGASASDDKIATQKAVYLFVKAIETSMNNAKVGKSGDETISDTKTFSSSPEIPAATLVNHPVTLAQLNSVVLNGALPASESQLGLTKFATSAQAAAGTDTDPSGNPLVVKPSDVQKAGIKWSAVKNYVTNDIVNYLGTLYKALLDNTNVVPTFFTNGNSRADLESSVSSGTFGGGNSYAATFNDSMTRSYHNPSSANLITQTMDFDENGVISNVAIENTVALSSLGISGYATDMYVSPDETKLFLAMNSGYEMIELTMATAGDITTASVTYRMKYRLHMWENKVMKYVTMAREGALAGKRITFSTTSTDSFLKTIDLETAWDLSSHKAHKHILGFFDQGTTTYGHEFNSDKTKLWVIEAATLVEYALSTAGDIRTGKPTGITKDLAALGIASPRRLKARGTSLYVYDLTGDLLEKLTFGTADNIATLTHSGQTLHLGSVNGNMSVFDISSDELHIFAAPSNATTLYKWTCASAGQIAGASYNGAFTVSGTSGSTYDIGFCNDDDNLFIAVTALNMFKIGFTTKYNPVGMTLDQTASVSGKFAAAQFYGGMTIESGKLYMNGSADYMQMLEFTGFDFSTLPNDHCTASRETKVTAGNENVTGMDWYGENILMVGFDGAEYSFDLEFASAYDIYSAKTSNVAASSSTWGRYINKIINKRFVIYANTQTAANATTFYAKEFERTLNDKWTPSAALSGSSEIKILSNSDTGRTIVENAGAAGYIIPLRLYFSNPSSSAFYKNGVSVTSMNDDIEYLSQWAIEFAQGDTVTFSNANNISFSGTNTMLVVYK